MPDQQSIDLLPLCDLRIPGGGKCVDDTIYVRLNKASRIGRLRLELREPILFPQEYALKVRLNYAGVVNLRHDIKAGDFCFPEVNIVSEDGEIFRFKRGNLKDFFDMDARETPQDILLPLSAFLYNVDYASNTPASGRFFEKPIKSLFFDFLSPQLAQEELQLIAPSLEPQEATLPSVFSYLDILAHHTLSEHEIFSTASPRLLLRVSKNDIGVQICGPNTVFQIHNTTAAGGAGAPRDWPIKDGPNYIEIPMPHLGGHRLKFRLTSQGAVLAESMLSAVRFGPTAASPASGMGISDDQNFAGGLIHGGGFARIVMGLKQVRRSADGFNFDPNSTILDVLGNQRTDWIVAFKSMPPFLQQDAPHAYRKGPNDIGLYREMMAWLVPILENAGVTVFESWNEANVIHEWTGSFDDLTEMHGAVYDAAEASGQGSVVLTPSSTTWDQQYFEQILTSPMAEQAHGLGMHGYTYVPRDADALFSGLDETIAGSAVPNLPVYITEVGFRVPAYSEEQQALWMALFTLHCFFRPRFRRIAWFRYKNTFPESLSNYNQNASSGYGMVGYGGRYSRPALVAYRFLNRLLSEASATELERNDGQIIFHGRYRGKTLTCVWGAGPAPAARFCYDIYGNHLNESTDAELRILTDVDPAAP